MQGNYAYVGAVASTWASASGWTKLNVQFSKGAADTVTVFVHGCRAQEAMYADNFDVS